MKLLMAKEGIRQIEDADNKIAHELADCLWCILVLSDKYKIDIEKAFIDNMKVIESGLKRELKK